ncbi:MAG: transcriptional regulator, partial [Bacteroidales bacterium]|nr:transcriptional regulator [Bacteroidales bacterium]
MNRLDSLIACKDVFVEAKEQKIEQLRIQAAHARTEEERYWMNKMFYDEYFVYNSDSAMLYVNANLDISDKLNRKEWLAEWRIKKSFLLSATGLLKEALDVLEGIDGKRLPHDLQIEYYGQMMYLYSHFGQYSQHDMGRFSQGYYRTEGIYKDSIYAALLPEDPFYLWYKGWKFLATEDAPEVIHELKLEVDASPLETRRDAMNAYILACLCREAGRTEEYLKYMILSAMADVRTANRDIASLEELSKALFELGDIDHSYT